MSNWLITGGAGYIGAHVVHALQKLNFSVWIIDDLSADKRNSISELANFQQISLLDEKSLDLFFSRNRFDGVIHLAGLKSVADSFLNPLGYMEVNCQGTVNLLAAMNKHSVKKMIFSSTAAVYSGNTTDVIPENSVLNPANPYGRSKLAAESAIIAACSLGNLNAVIFRYFNVIGSMSFEFSEINSMNVLPKAISDIKQGNLFEIFGDDFDTPDGTCVRDFIHVLDLTSAHIKAVEFLEKMQTSFEIINLGSGKGYSVLQVILELESISQQVIRKSISSRRQGDIGFIVADITKAWKYLNWRPARGIQEMISDAWRFSFKEKML
jgi:UDP-glucose 4-epimerase